MNLRSAAIGAGWLSLCACRSIPEYAPPQQRPSFEGFKQHASRIVNMGDPDAPLHFVRDISDGLNGSWRWVEGRPALKVRVRSDEQLKYTIDFTLPEATFKETGPVTITFTVNDHVLDRVRYEQQGGQHFEKPVPAEWLKPGEDAIVGAEIDKVWIAKEDGAKLGFILSRMGLTP